MLGRECLRNEDCILLEREREEGSPSTQPHTNVLFFSSSTAECDVEIGVFCGDEGWVSVIRIVGVGVGEEGRESDGADGGR